MGAFLCIITGSCNSSSPDPTPAPTPPPCPSLPPAPLGPGFRVWQTKAYTSFEVEVVCDSFAGYGFTTRFYYELEGPSPDSTSLVSIAKDVDLADNCQQKSLDTYTPRCEEFPPGTLLCYNNGFLVSPSQLEGNDAIEDAYYITNILPQVAAFNEAGGAWGKSEEIIACSRGNSDVKKHTIFGGPIFNSCYNDDFLGSHGIPTPDEFWKVVIRYFDDERATPEVVAWLMPNKETSTADKLDEYVVTIDELKSITDTAMSQTIGEYLDFIIPDNYIEKTSSWQCPLN